jgi:hypothetical protein
MGVTGYILGLTENADGVAYGLRSFTISNSQEVSLELQKSSIESFNKAINELNMNDIRIDAKGSKNADSIRKADTALRTIKEQLLKTEDLKPKNCNCYCGWESSPDTVNATVVKELNQR